MPVKFTVKILANICTGGFFFRACETQGHTLTGVIEDVTVLILPAQSSSSPPALQPPGSRHCDYSSRAQTLGLYFAIDPELSLSLMGASVHHGWTTALVFGKSCQLLKPFKNYNEIMINNVFKEL